jgi:single-strand DNA-binding protein
VSANIGQFFVFARVSREKFIFFIKFISHLFYYISFSYFYIVNNYDMELQGTVKKVFETQTFASGFQKREMVILTQEQYPQPINIEFLSDKISLLDNVSEGENVKVGINIRGREWVSPQGETKYFNSITGWRLEKVSDNGSEPTQAMPSQSASPVSNENPFAGDDDDDLPF